MSKTRVSIIVPTYNRARIWKKGLLLDSLARQSSRAFDLLIADDNSDDASPEIIRDELGKRGLKARLFIIHAPKELDTQASALPDNVLFKESNTEWIIHCDDDGWVDVGLVSFVSHLLATSTPAAYFGRTTCVDPESLNALPDGDDPRTRWPFARTSSDVIEMPRDKQAQFGALWASPLNCILKIGGHEMENLPWRGSDSRIGLRMGQVMPTYFVTKEAMRFWHLGLPWQTVAVDRHGAGFVMRNQRLPQYMTYRPTSSVANGGLHFWSSGQLDGLYEEVNL